MAKFDLHMHSGYSSDGQLSCGQLVQMAKETGLETIALCDHDSMKGVREITEIAEGEGIEVLPGIECTTDMDGYSVHLLGYGCDADDPYLSGLSEMMEARSAAAFGKRVARLEEKYGIHVDREDILKRANGKNPWFTLIDTILLDPKIQAHPDFQPYLPGGNRCDPAPVNFFWDCCQKGSDLYVHVETPDFFDSIDRIHKAGGVAVIAHPFSTFFHEEERLQQAIEHGIDGLEAYSNYHTPEQTEWYRDFAGKHNLLITCGSDFHGEKKPNIRMGEYGMSEDGTCYLEALKEAMAKAGTKA